MSFDYCELEELRKKLVKLGIVPVYKKGEKGDKGDAGPLISSSTEGIFFTTFKDTTKNNQLEFDTPWLVPNPTKHFILYENSVGVETGIYEITLSGSITNVTNDNGGSFFLQTEEQDTIKDLTFTLEEGDLSKMYFSRTILFRFEKDTVLEVASYISGNLNTANVEFKDINLYIKKIHE